MKKRLTCIVFLSFVLPARVLGKVRKGTVLWFLSGERWVDAFA